MSSTSAAARVLATPELGESILSHLDILNLLQSQGVSNTFKISIATSIKLQRALFFATAPSLGRLQINAFLLDSPGIMYARDYRFFMHGSNGKTNLETNLLTLKLRANVTAYHNGMIDVQLKVLGREKKPTSKATDDQQNQTAGTSSSRTPKWLKRVRKAIFKSESKAKIDNAPLLPVPSWCRMLAVQPTVPMDSEITVVRYSSDGLGQSVTKKMNGLNSASTLGEVADAADRMVLKAREDDALALT